MPRLPPVTSTERPAGGCVVCSLTGGDAIGRRGRPDAHPTSGTGSRSAYPPALGSAPMRAIQVSRFGGPEVLEVVDLPVPEPDSPRLLLDVEAAGINYADTHQVADDYLAPQTLPFVPGAEVVGRDADGRRVVALVTNGGYAEQVLAHPATTFALPDQIDDTTALAFILQGTTAWHLLQTSAHFVPGESVLVHGAAGGVGSLAVQLARE